MSEAEFQASTLNDVAHPFGWRSMFVRTSIAGTAGGYSTATTCPGWPDVVLWHPERHLVLFREFKTDSGVLSPVQSEVLHSLHEAHADVDVWRPKHLDAHIIPLLTGTDQ